MVTGPSPSNMLAGTNLTTTGWKTISWDSGCSGDIFTNGDQYALVFGSDDMALKFAAYADGIMSSGTAT